MQDREVLDRAPDDGILIGRTRLTLVYEGEALFHLARFYRVFAAAGQVRVLQYSGTDLRTLCQ